VERSGIEESISGKIRLLRSLRSVEMTPGSKQFAALLSNCIGLHEIGDLE